MKNNGYRSYRGRGSGKKHIGVILLILVLALACAVLFFQRFVTYSDTGEMYLDIPLPWQDKDPAPASPNTDDLNLVIDDPEEQEPETPPQPEPPVYSDRRLLDLPKLPADPEALKAMLAEAGANGFVYTVKDDAGQIFFDAPSALRSAVAAGAPTGEVLAPFCQMEGVLAAARLNCFHDSYYAYANMESAGLCQSTGYVWYDNHSYHWLDPTKEAARQYVIDLALECAQLGFDEIILDDLSYPTAGKLQKIDYRDADRAAALTQFLQELRTTLEPYDVKISLVLPEALIAAGGDAELTALSGQDPQRLLPLADAVFVPTQEPDSLRLTAVLPEDTNVPALVPITAELPLYGHWYLVK